MQLADRMSALWHGLRAGSPGAARARRRVAATGAMAAFVLMLLAAAGLLHFLLTVVAVVAVCASIVALAFLARRHSAAVPRAARRLIRAALRRGVGLRKGIGSGLAHLRRAWSRVRAAANSRLAAAAADSRRRGHAVASRLRVWGERWSKRNAHDRRRDALRLNAAGAQLRRQSAYPEAAEQHRLALALFRDLGDRRSEALTLNSLALALDPAGDVTALELFEEAATILGELGDEQHEGQVIANLALAFRRRGREERSAEVLEIALGKLDRASQAYRKIEGLRRAS
ncbi:MAG: hypothetical protein ACJ74L_07945 [Gaiellaceae bacterium]